MMKLKKCIRPTGITEGNKIQFFNKSLHTGAAIPLKRQSSKSNSLDSRIPSLSHVSFFDRIVSFLDLIVSFLRGRGTLELPHI